MPFFQQLDPAPSDVEETSKASDKGPLPAFTGVIDDEKGATAIEYALIAAGIAIAILAIVFAVGEEISSLFAQVQQLLADRDPGGG